MMMHIGQEWQGVTHVHMFEVGPEGIPAIGQYVEARGTLDGKPVTLRGDVVAVRWFFDGIDDSYNVHVQLNTVSAKPADIHSNPNDIRRS